MVTVSAVARAGIGQGSDVVTALSRRHQSQLPVPTGRHQSTRLAARERPVNRLLRAGLRSDAAVSRPELVAFEKGSRPVAGSSS